MVLLYWAITGFPWKLVLVSNIIAISIYSAFSMWLYYKKEAYTFKAIVSSLIIL